MLEWLLFLLLRYFNSLFGVLNWMLICRQKADRRHTSSGLCASLMTSWSLLAQYVCMEERKEQIYHCDSTSGWLPSSFVCTCVGR